MSAKVKPNDKQTFKEFEIQIDEITWKKRCELNDKMLEHSSGKIPPFSFWGEIVLNYTPLTEEEINKFSTDEIIAMANKVFEVANSKKK